MEDREIVAAIAAGDLAALADAYDQYAESLYGYCRWVLNEPDDAADAVLDTFVVAAGKLGDLQDPRKLRPWLYAVARNECHRRRHAPQLGLDEAGLPAPAAGVSDSADRAELLRLVRTALSGLSPGEREVLELSLRHDLQGADLAAVLGVSRNQAHALASGALGQLESALGALLVARTGRRDCARLDLLLADGDGRLTTRARKEISRHIDQCEICDDRRRGVLRPATLFGMTPLVALPLWLRREMLRLCADDSEATLAYRHEVMLRAGPLRPNGFPQAVRQPKQRKMVALSRIAAAAGIVIALASAGIISALALGGSHAPHAVAGARTSTGQATASAAQTPGASSASAVPPPSTLPATSPSVAAEQAPAAVPSVSASASASASAKPSPSRSASSSASPRPKPSASLNTPTPAPTLTSTGTPLPTPTSSPSFPT